MAHGRCSNKWNSYSIFSSRNCIRSLILTGSIFDDWFFFCFYRWISNNVAGVCTSLQILGIYISKNEIVLFSVIQQMAGRSQALIQLKWFPSLSVSCRLWKHWNSITFTLSLFVWISSFSAVQILSYNVWYFKRPLHQRHFVWI